MPIDNTKSLQAIIETATPDQLRIIMSAITASPNQKINLTGITKAIGTDKATCGINQTVWNTLKDVGLVDGNLYDGTATIHNSLGKLNKIAVNTNDASGTAYYIEPNPNPGMLKGSGPYDVITAIGFSKVWSDEYDGYQTQLDYDKSVGIAMELEIRTEDENGNPRREFITVKDNSELTKEKYEKTEKTAKDNPDGSFIAQDQYDLYPEFEPTRYAGIRSSNDKVGSPSQFSEDILGVNRAEKDVLGVIGASEGRDILTPNGKEGAIGLFIIDTLEDMAGVSLGTPDDGLTATYLGIKRFNKVLAKLAAVDENVATIIEKIGTVYADPNDPDKQKTIGPIARTLGLTPDAVKSLKKLIQRCGYGLGSYQIIDGILSDNPEQIRRGISNIVKFTVEIYVVNAFLKEYLLPRTGGDILNFIRNRLIRFGMTAEQAGVWITRLLKGGTLVFAVAELVGSATGDLAEEAAERERLRREAEENGWNESIYVMSGGKWKTDPPTEGFIIDPNSKPLPGQRILPESWWIIDHHGVKRRIPIPGTAWLGQGWDQDEEEWQQVKQDEKWYEAALRSWRYTPAYWILKGVDAIGEYVVENSKGLLEFLGILPPESEPEKLPEIEYKVPFIIIFDKNIGFGAWNARKPFEDLTQSEIDELQSKPFITSDGTVTNYLDYFYPLDISGVREKWFTETSPQENIAVDQFIENTILPQIKARRLEWMGLINTGKRKPVGDTSPENFFEEGTGDFYMWWQETYPNENWLNPETYIQRLWDIIKSIRKQNFLKNTNASSDSFMDLQLDVIVAQNEFNKSFERLNQISELVDQQINPDGSDGTSNVPPVDLNKINENVSFALNIDNKFFFSSNDMYWDGYAITPASTPYCFSNNTYIKMKDGNKKISEINVGDLIISFDINGNLCDDIVTSIHLYENRPLNRYLIENDILLEVTDEHPVLTINGNFTEICNLNVGDYLVDVEGSGVKIVDKMFIGNDTVYNISVSQNETYIANNIRVHNKPAVPYNAETIMAARDNLKAIVSDLDEIREFNEKARADFEKQYRDFLKRQKEKEVPKPKEKPKETPIVVVNPPGGPRPPGNTIPQQAPFGSYWSYRTGTFGSGWTPIRFGPPLSNTPPQSGATNTSNIQIQDLFPRRKR